MRWLRERPERWDDLDLVDGKGRWKEGAGGAGRLDEDEEMMAESRKGALFDEDDEVDDDEEEEEDEDAPVQVTVPLPPTPTVTAHPPTPSKGLGASPRGTRR